MTLDAVPRELLVAVAALLAAIVALGALRRALADRRRRRRFARAAAGEREAVALLEAAGFEVVDRQVGRVYELAVDGAPVEALVRADYLVRDGARRYVAEVKTGRAAPSLATATTRRQLLEYQHAFGVAGVLLVDADARSVRRVDFRAAAGRPRRAVLGWVLVGALVGAVLAAPAWFLAARPGPGCGPPATFARKAR